VKEQVRTEKIDIQKYNFESTNQSKLVLTAKTKVSEVLTQV
jgi:hypothetical protein